MIFIYIYITKCSDGDSLREKVQKRLIWFYSGFLCVICLDYWSLLLCFIFIHLQVTEATTGTSHLSVSLRTHRGKPSDS